MADCIRDILSSGCLYLHGWKDVGLYVASSLSTQECIKMNESSLGWWGPDKDFFLLKSSTSAHIPSTIYVNSDYWQKWKISIFI